MKIEINSQDIIDVNMNMIHSLVFEANSTVEKEKKIKNLLIAKKTIENTLGLMGFNGKL